MDEKTAAAIREDFLTWSGGFSPDSDMEIFVYIEYAAPRDIDKQELTELLNAWMDSEDTSQ